MEVIVYINSLDFIKDNLKIGTKIVLRSGLVFWTVSECDNSYIITCTDRRSEKRYSLKHWFDKGLVESDSQNLFEYKVYKTAESVKPETPKIEKVKPLDYNNYEDYEDNEENTDKTVNPFVSKKEASRVLYNLNYSTFFSKLKYACGSSKFGKYAWHITHVNNLVSIIKNGCLYSRYHNNRIPYDNVVRNDTTKSVMGTNYCDLIERYVRLYFNPVNKAFYPFKANMGDNLVFIAFKFDFIIKSPQPVLLNIGMGHSMEREDFDWKKYAINQRHGTFRINNCTEEKLKAIYYLYDKDASTEDKELQMSEILIYKELDISYISKIYFQNEFVMDKFLDEIKHLNCYNQVKDKCVVDVFIFKGSVNDSYY